MIVTTTLTLSKKVMKCYKSMHAAVEHAAAERGPGSALVRAPLGCGPAGADSARTRRGIRGLGARTQDFSNADSPVGYDETAIDFMLCADGTLAM